MDELLLKACAAPTAYSGHTDKDGTPLTNLEYYYQINNIHNDGWH